MNANEARRKTTKAARVNAERERAERKAAEYVKARAERNLIRREGRKKLAEAYAAIECEVRSGKRKAYVSIYHDSWSECLDKTYFALANYVRDKLRKDEYTVSIESSSDTARGDDYGGSCSIGLTITW